MNFSKKNFPKNIKFDEGEKKFFNICKDYNLIIHDTITTSGLESMCFNAPTLFLIWAMPVISVMLFHENEILILLKNIFKFYSIFQWNERKGWRELLGAYLDEFSSKDNFP